MFEAFPETLASGSRIVMSHRPKRNGILHDLRNSTILRQMNYARLLHGKSLRAMTVSGL